MAEADKEEGDNKMFDKEEDNKMGRAEGGGQAGITCDTGQPSPPSHVSTL